ncbi:aminomethyl-transferring glycine dehydrogenase subunit GcvPB [Candidatus Neomarinimicrobiota bacterium]
MQDRLIFDRSAEGRIGSFLPVLDVPATDPATVLDNSLLRNVPAALPEVSEPQVARHFINLSAKNHHVDKDLYPLGSCTMKYNPKINDIAASFPGFGALHPRQREDHIQGALELTYELEQALIAMTGMSRYTLQPAAGSQGELVGVLIMQKYHATKGRERKYVIIPDSAHGTNPASVIMAGFDTIKVATDARGRVDLDDLRSKITDDVAGMMLTQPNTLGLFEDHIKEITDLIHSVDGLMYMDGANLNALLGLTTPALMGFDITHINLHKTFSTPHGGGGPGSGPIGVVESLIEYLPRPLVVKDAQGHFSWETDTPGSIGRVHGYFGNFGMLVRAYAYILALGESGIRRMTEAAVINANYLKTKLKSTFELPFEEGTMHEFVLSGSRQKERGAKTLDIAKALLDEGFHAPTIYFPLVVPEALMIEPTESETKATLDRFIEAIEDIDKRIDTDLESLTGAPRKTPVRRLDETRANRELNVRWYPEGRG